MNKTDDIELKSFGHVRITDCDTGEVLLDNYNALHPENLSEAVCLTLANRDEGNIHEMVFGNGASTISGTGAVTYFPPNSVGADASLYNQTYAKIVDDKSPLNTEPETNFIRVNHVQNKVYTDIDVVCVLNRSEPAGQDAFDDAEDMDALFIFDEIGLRSYSEDPEKRRLLGHIVFNPIQKSLNRSLKFEYKFRIYFG